MKAHPAFRSLVVSIASLLVSPIASHAAFFTWDGGSATVNNWNDATNWIGDVAPVDAIDTDLIYTGTAPRLTSTNTANDFNVRLIRFDPGAANYTIQTNNGARTMLTNGGIIQNSSNAQTFAFAGNGALSLDQSGSSITGAGTGLLTIGNAVGNGVIGTRSSSGTNTLTVNNASFDVLINSTIQNNAGGAGLFGLNKANTGVLTLRGTNTHTGGTSVNGGQLVLDYATLATGNRIGDATSVNFSGGDLRLLGNGSATTVETIGAFNVSTRGGKLTLLPGAGQSATFTAATLNRTNINGSIIFRGIGLGGSGADTSNVFFTTAPTGTSFVGGGGAAGTPQISIIPYALGDTSTSGLGVGLVTYDTAAGVRLLNETTEFAPYATAVVNDNARITTSGTIAGVNTVNSLLLKNSSGSPMLVTIQDATNLAPVSGTFLFSGDASSPIELTRDTLGLGNGSITLATNTSAQMFVTANTTASVNVAVGLNVSGGLVKHGAGTLILNQNITRTGFANTESAVITIAGGTLKAGADNIVGQGKTDTAAGSGWFPAVTVTEGGTWDINGFNQTFNAAGRLDVAAGGIVTNSVAGVNTIRFYGPSVLGGGTLPTVNVDGLFLANTGQINLDLSVATNNTGNQRTTFNRAGHTLNDVTLSATNSDRLTVTFNTLLPTDSNTITGGFTLTQTSNNINSIGTLVGNAVTDGTITSKPLGNATITFTGTLTNPTNTGALTINVSSNILGTPLTSANTTAWTNDIVVNGAKPALITLGRGDGLSSGFTHQLDELFITGAARTLQVAANDSTVLEFSGSTTFSHTGSTTSTFNVTAGTLKLNGITETGSGSKGLSKNGAGVLILDDLLAYSGATNVNAGTLLITGSLSGTTNISVSANAILGGTGTITPSGVLNVAPDGIVAPGVGLGTLTFDSMNTSAVSGVTFASGAKFTFQLGAAFASDRFALINGASGDVSFGGNTIQFADLTSGSLTAGTYTLFTSDVASAYTGLTTDGSGFITAGLSIGTGLEAYGGASLQVVGNDIVLQLIPEPGSATLVLGGLALLLGSRRDRCRFEV